MKFIAMKPVAIFCLLLFISVSALAQIQPQQQFDEKRLFYIKKTEKYRKLRNTGMFLTVAGGVFIGLAISSISKAAAANNSASSGYYGTSNAGSSYETAAVFELLFAEGSLGAGIPLWIVGGHSMKKYQRKLGMEFKTNYGQRQAGIAFTYRF